MHLPAVSLYLCSICLSVEVDVFQTFFGVWCNRSSFQDYRDSVTPSSPSLPSSLSIAATATYIIYTLRQRHFRIPSLKTVTLLYLLSPICLSSFFSYCICYPLDKKQATFYFIRNPFPFIYTFLHSVFISKALLCYFRGCSLNGVVIFLSELFLAFLFPLDFVRFEFGFKLISFLSIISHLKYTTWSRNSEKVCTIRQELDITYPAKNKVATQILIWKKELRESIRRSRSRILSSRAVYVGISNFPTISFNTKLCHMFTTSILCGVRQISPVCRFRVECIFFQISSPMARYYYL